MPIHEYECSHCGWKGERIVSVDTRDNQLCMNFVPNNDFMFRSDRMFNPKLLERDHTRDGLRCLQILTRVEISQSSWKMGTPPDDEF